MIYLLTAIGLTPGDSSTVYIYTQTIHRTTQWRALLRGPKNFTTAARQFATYFEPGFLSPHFKPCAFLYPSHRYHESTYIHKTPTKTFCHKWHIYSAFGKSLCAYKRCWKSIERTIVSKNWLKPLHALPVLHFNRCLTTEYSETTAHFNGNFDTDN
jgi:hypothetical protein